MELLRSLAVHPDRAVIVVTHDPRVFEFGDRIATMDDGRVVEVKSAETRMGSGVQKSIFRGPESSC